MDYVSVMVYRSFDKGKEEIHAVAIQDGGRSSDDELTEQMESFAQHEHGTVEVLHVLHNVDCI